MAAVFCRQAGAAMPHSFTILKQSQSATCFTGQSALLQRPSFNACGNCIHSNSPNLRRQAKTSFSLCLTGKHRRKGAFRCNADNESGGFSPGQLQRDMERLKRQEEKKKEKRRQRILKASDPSPAKEQTETKSGNNFSRRVFDELQVQQDLDNMRGQEAREKVLKSGRDELGDGFSSEELQEARSFFAKTKELSDSATSATKSLIDTILVTDFFFVLAILFWLIAGVVERQALDSTRLLDAWLPLWGTVFQPAIGVLMLGTIVSGTISTLSKNPDE